MAPLANYRCKQCGKLLLRATLIDSELEVKCSRCREVNVFKGAEGQTLLCLVRDCPRRVRAARRA